MSHKTDVHRTTLTLAAELAGFLAVDVHTFHVQSTFSRLRLLSAVRHQVHTLHRFIYFPIRHEMVRLSLLLPWIQFQSVNDLYSRQTTFKLSRQTTVTLVWQSGTILGRKTGRTPADVRMLTTLTLLSAKKRPLRSVGKRHL